MMVAVFLWLWVIQPPSGHWQTFGAYPMTRTQCARIVADIHSVPSASRVRFACAPFLPSPLG